MLSLIFSAALASSPAIGLIMPPTLAPEPTPVASAPLLQGVAVTLECAATPQGRVEGCFVLAETHPGMGFGEAAIALMDEAEVDPVPEAFQFARTIQFTP
ncbi:hypothetical protein [Brevundimonas aurifodinae]|uniref:TonB C-terminal domain-containing protein n=2 Tax=Brevundimonas TaxID=41275 RepID=A0ABV1NSM5_9CAUL|nr:MAG: hypothetical protein B7Z42_10450 [Brevundimonas sp. 12-68-7]OYX32229.1 MAG: hypothetical protein B7Z01_11475 [Brevundimonas subvibrioides]